MADGQYSFVSSYAFIIKASLFIKTFIYKGTFICKDASIYSHHINLVNHTFGDSLGTWKENGNDGHDSGGSYKQYTKWENGFNKSGYILVPYWQFHHSDKN